MLENVINHVLFVLLVSQITECNFAIENLEAMCSKNMAANSSSTGQDENIHSGFSSESESDISIETETETETESDTDSSDSEASFMGNLQDVDRNNDEWRQVLDRDNDEPNFLNIFLCWGLQVL